MKHPKGGRGGGKANLRKKAKKGVEDEWSSNSDSADDDDGGSSDEENQDGPARERMPPTTRARAACRAGMAKEGQSGRKQHGQSCWRWKWELIGRTW
jgi:hypothetical protein